jgi:uncharacterized membrane protein
MGICPHCQGKRIDPLRTLLSHGGFPVACPSCGRYSYLPRAPYLVHLLLYVTGVLVALLSLTLATWLPIVFYGAVLSARVAWQAFGALMVPIETSEASMRRSFAWLGIAVAVVVILLALASGFHWRSA